MTIDEAIKTLERDLEDKIMPHKTGVRKAEQLGVEALKEVKSNRDSGFSSLRDLLPGETEK